MNSPKAMKVAGTILFILCLVVKSTSSYATHFFSATLDELVNESDFVLIGEIRTVKRTLLGYRKAALRTEKIIKGKALSEVLVNYGEPWHYSQSNVPVLIEGKQYLFFLKKQEEEYLLSGIVGSKYYYIEDNDEVLCGDEIILVQECIEKIKEIISRERKGI